MNLVQKQSTRRDSLLPVAVVLRVQVHASVPAHLGALIVKEEGWSLGSVQSAVAARGSNSDRIDEKMSNGLRHNMTTR
jgi:hypothetical protein